MTIEEFQEFIKRVFDELGVDIITLYAPDPWTGGERYRLIFMDGVEDTAPMYGPTPKQGEARLINNPPTVSKIWAVEGIAKEDLFRKSSFAKRERVRSLIRCHLYYTTSTATSNRPDAILFLSYRKRMYFSQNYLKQIERAVSAVEALLAGQKILFFKEPDTYIRYIEALSTIMRKLRDILSESDVEKIVEVILRTALELTNTFVDGYAGLYILQSDRRHLKLSYELYGGKCSQPNLPKIDISCRNCIPALVAENAEAERPLLFTNIKDALEKFPSRYTYSPPKVVHNGIEMKSVLAVPMYARGELMGVLNLESPKEEAFTPEHVRVLEVLADVAAAAITESQLDARLQSVGRLLANINPARELFHVTEDIIKNAKQELEADEVDIWFYSEKKGFGKEGFKSSGKCSAPPRPNGFSNWLIKNAPEGVKSLLFTDMNYDENRKRWNYKLEIVTETEAGGFKREVVDEPSRKGMPAALHPKLSPKTRAEVGLPLIIDNQTLGVLWVKWRYPRFFTDGEVGLLSLFAYQASLAFHLQRQLEPGRTEALKPIFKDVLGKARAEYFVEIERREKLNPTFLPQITVMFADLRASTGILSILSGTKEGRDIFNEFINDFYRTATSIVHKYGGTLATFLGDGIMAIFGAPLKDDEEKSPAYHATWAAIAALQLADYFEKHYQDWVKAFYQNAQGHPVPERFALGIGLHTDWAMVGNFAVGGGFNYTAVGQAPTVAARVQDMARFQDLADDKLWPLPLPQDPQETPKAVVLCTEYMRQFFGEYKNPKNRWPTLPFDIELTPLSNSVQLKGFGVVFNLGVLRKQ
jgi:GAF domain-containing protein/class 3 adenylate cyclase